MEAWTIDPRRRRGAIGVPPACRAALGGLLGLCALTVSCSGGRRPPEDLRVPARHRVSVATGLDSLEQTGYTLLVGKRVGLITNAAGVDADLRSDVDLLTHAPRVELVALFVPEHGLRGDAASGTAPAGLLPGTRLPVYSLAERTRKPTPAMLRGIDVLVYDVQDIGIRSYTYVSTLGLCMEAAAEARIPFVVLDRPDPLGGDRIEGNIPEPAFRSFVGQYPMPYVYGLTAGELARMIVGQGWLHGTGRCALTVVPMRGYRRNMTWADTGLAWVPTSPNIPHPDTAEYCAATGILGELAALDNGAGYTLPFELIGAPGLSPERLERALAERHVQGMSFRAAAWIPYAGRHKDVECGGVEVYVTDPRRAALTRVTFEALDAIRRIAPSIRLFSDSARSRMFDLVCGTDRVRRMLAAGETPGQVWKMWGAGTDAFRVRRRPYLLYP